MIWVKPELVAEVEFRAWTADGLLRHAVVPRPARGQAGARDRPRGAGGDRAGAEAAACRLTHPDRVYWPDAGVTKQGLADYYAAVWPRMAPLVVNRPVALLRCPGGIARPVLLPEARLEGPRPRDPDLPRPARRRRGRRSSPSTACPGLIGLVQGGALEIHTWQSTLDDLEHPDQIVMDLDPGEGVAWPAVIDAAREVRDRFEAAGLAAFVKTSGGKGLHVVAPLDALAAAGTRSRASPHAMAQAMAADEPDRYVATIAKAKRTGTHPRSTTCATAATTPRSSPTAPAPAPARRSRCRSPGTSSAPRSAPRTSPSPTPPPASPTPPTPGPTSASAAAPLPGR